MWAKSHTAPRFNQYARAGEKLYFGPCGFNDVYVSDEVIGDDEVEESFL